MATLTFQGEGPASMVTLGPAPRFRVSGNFIRDLHGRILARYHHHYWEAEGRHFSRYDCRPPVAIHFEDVEGGCTETYGPFQKFWVADGSVYADGNLVCKFMDPTLMWHDHQGDTFWPILVIKDP